MYTKPSKHKGLSYGELLRLRDERRKQYKMKQLSTRLYDQEIKKEEKKEEETPPCVRMGIADKYHCQSCDKKYLAIALLPHCPFCGVAGQIKKYGPF